MNQPDKLKEHNKVRAKTKHDMNLCFANNSEVREEYREKLPKNSK